MTTTPNFNCNRLLIEASSRRAMDALLVTIQVLGGVVANWTDQDEHIKGLDKRDRELRDAMNAAERVRKATE